MRTEKGDQFLVRLMMDPGHEEVQGWIRDMRESSDEARDMTDEEIIEWTIVILSVQGSSEAAEGSPGVN